MKSTKRQPADELPSPGRTMVAAYSAIFVVVPILTFIIGRFLDGAFLLPSFPPFPFNLAVGFTVFIFGLTIGIKSTRLLYHEGRGLPWGEVQMETQSTSLVTTSLYACCRNPMTFGYSLLPCGMGLVFRSLTMTFLIPAVIFSTMIIWLRLREEPRLEQRFGQVYRDYKRRTPFLIPRFKPLIIDLTAPVLQLQRRQSSASRNPDDPDDATQPNTDDHSMLKDQRPRAKAKRLRQATPKIPREKITIFQHRLLRWYHQHGRDLPWRHTRDPYRILISEVMLQQTQVDRVIPKYHEWLAAYPTFESLAAAPLDEIERTWRPLGYNFRPKRLQRIAKYVVTHHNGELPHTFEELIALPGVGRYTAGAILSFAFHQDAPIVDTNVRRLTQRFYGVPGNPKTAAVDKEVWRLTEAMIPHHKGFIFNQALIDFGAMICTARDPACSSCFVNDLCSKSKQIGKKSG